MHYLERVIETSEQVARVAAERKLSGELDKLRETIANYEHRESILFRQYKGKDGPSQDDHRKVLTLVTDLSYDVDRLQTM